MINRFRNVVTSVITGLPSVNKASDSDYAQVSETAPPELPVKHSYGRAHFLQLNEDEVQVAADHLCRLIIIPRDANILPWCAGYAEVINAGKTKLNEDQARASTLFVHNRRRNSTKVTRDYPCPEDSSTSQPMQPCSETTESSLTTENIEALNNDPSPLTYFAIFDGHAGTGAALMAANHLHDIVVRQLRLVVEPLMTRQCAMNHPDEGEDTVPLPYGDKSERITTDSLVTGALQRAFVLMDSVIEKERVTYQISGGCAALVAVFFLGRLYIANAGDARAVVCHGEDVMPLSTDFTPQSERTRIEHLACVKPELLKGDFCRLEFQRRITRKDIGQQMLYRDAWMTGWSSKVITEKDLRFPLIYGEGKRTRMLATIGVTRGFGDHSLCVYDTDIAIKPFMLSVPEVKVYDLTLCDVSENDVLIMGSDGLWDVTSNEKAASIVRASLTRLAADNPVRYTSAAHDLVMHARGMLHEGNWRIASNEDPSTSSTQSASTDDITAFVIPLHRYKAECTAECTAESSSSPGSSVEIITADGD